MQHTSPIGEFYDLSNEILKADEKALVMCQNAFEEIEHIKEYNQLKMLKAFTNCGVGAEHLVGTTGYGIGDIGRDKIEQIFAELTASEAALFRHNFASGTHTLAVVLFGLLRPGHTMVCVTGTPYDTLHGVIGINGRKSGENGINNGEVISSENYGSLKDFGINYEEIDLIDNSEPDYDKIQQQCKTAQMCYIQRSRGYKQRKALSLEQIKKISTTAKAANPSILVVVDNCYGEFTNKKEPTQYGADLMAGSLIKNPGGGIAPTGGYIAGKKQLVELCAHRLTAPGVGGEIGCTLDVLRQMYLGLYYAPAVTAEALKASAYAAALFETLGFSAQPHYNEKRDDIITSVQTGSEKAMCALCKGVQTGSPIDSFATPEPSDMPGYEDKVIMAAGAFTMGSSIELSADGPMRPPYTVYVQGGINFNAARAGILLGAQNIINLQK